jgi:hypothetical protein
VKAEVTKRVIAMATRVASSDDGNGNGGKSNGDGKESGGRATMRAMVSATPVAGDDEGNCDGDDGGKRQRG